MVDEAHGAEAEARRAFSLELAAEDLTRIAQRVSAHESSRNVSVRAERQAVAANGEDGAALLYALTGKARAAGKLFAQAADDFSQPP